MGWILKLPVIHSFNLNFFDSNCNEGVKGKSTCLKRDWEFATNHSEKIIPLFCLTSYYKAVHVSTILTTLKLLKRLF